MRIVVCVKQIFHTYARTGMDPVTHYLKPEDIVSRVNPYDEVALEMALRVKALLPSREIIILTLGPLSAEHDLRRCLAMGADHLYQIDMPGRMDPWYKSWLLAKAVKDIGADLVLCGKESLDTRNGQVGAFVADHLGFSYVSAVRKLSAIADDGYVATVQRSAGRGLKEIVECALPAVFSIEADGGATGVPSYPSTREAMDYPIRKLYYDEKPHVSRTILRKSFPPRPRPKKVPVPDSSLPAYERILQLLSGGVTEKSGTILSGTPESQVEEILSFLREHGFLKPKQE